MIISCPSCNKKFEISSDLIPIDGRLLQCGSCNNEWFFKKNKQIDKITATIEEEKKPIQNNFDEKTIPDTIIEDPINKLESQKIENIVITDPNLDNNKSEFKNSENKSKNSILNLILVFVISSIALIILADTFKSPISLIIPDIELILYNLYETIKDIMLFFNDLF